MTRSNTALAARFARPAPSHTLKPACKRRARVPPNGRGPSARRGRPLPDSPSCGVSMTASVSAVALGRAKSPSAVAFLAAKGCLCAHGCQVARRPLLPLDQHGERSAPLLPNGLRPLSPAPQAGQSSVNGPQPAFCRIFGPFSHLCRNRNPKAAQATAAPDRLTE